MRILVELNPERAFFRYVYNVWLYIRLPYIWIMMTFLRTHFVIDMIGGVFFAYLALRMAEKICYVFDVFV